MAVTRAFVPGMRRRGRGRIVNVSSLMGRMALPLHGPYNASKYAVEALSDALRMELAPFGVHVTTVQPGTVRTDFEARAAGAFSRHLGTGSAYEVVLRRAQVAYARAYRSAPGPERVAHAVEHALTAPRPPARIIEPADRARVALAQALPTVVTDAIKRRGMGWSSMPWSITSR